MLKIVTSPDKFALQEKMYLSLRQKEGRIYSDEELQKLPQVSSNHPLGKEWKVRRHSCNKFIKSLSAKKKPLQILEIGCGNGWLCHSISQVKDCTVTGLDVNMPELEQAARVFPEIEFIYGDIFENIFPEKKFDIILFAASIQYFEDIPALLEKVFPLLTSNGVIHIIDCPVYTSDKEAEEAKQRSINYFIKQGFPEMAQYYYHHTLSSFQKFKPSIIKPNFFERLTILSYFPCMIIGHDNR